MRVPQLLPNPTDTCSALKKFIPSRSEMLVWGTSCVHLTWGICWAKKLGQYGKNLGSWELEREEEMVWKVGGIIWDAHHRRAGWKRHAAALPSMGEGGAGNPTEAGLGSWRKRTGDWRSMLAIRFQSNDSQDDWREKKEALACVQPCETCWVPGASFSLYRYLIYWLLWQPGGSHMSSLQQERTPFALLLLTWCLNWTFVFHVSRLCVSAEAKTVVQRVISTHHNTHI